MSDTCYIKDPSDERYCSECLADIPIELTWGDKCPECNREIKGFRDYEGYDEGKSFA